MTTIFGYTEDSLIQLVRENENVDAMFYLAQLYHSSNDLEKAKEFYEMAVKYNHTDAMVSMGVLSFLEDNFTLAENYFLMAVEYDRGNIDASLKLASLYEAYMEYELAEVYYLLAVQCGCAFAMSHLACLYEVQHRYDKAEKYHLMALKHREPEGTHVLYHISMFYHYVKKDYKEAEKYYLMSLEIKPEPSVMCNLGTLYHKLGNYVKSESYVLCSYKTDPKKRYLRHLSQLVSDSKRPFPWNKTTHRFFPVEFKEIAKTLMLVYGRKSVLRGIGKDVLLMIIKYLSELYCVDIR
eukprot:TRINITY_DN285_c0_g3_i1.p1 TRINITY_DN285_c0_g3~~TRINITY_DN285_c0_g3_i1.p1  ORF type:complete len:295 (+),score=42.95 TRINITY_DN285_c0_g3_i1:112-996(+)